MLIHEMSYVIESMFPGILGGEDYLLQDEVDGKTGMGRGKAEIIMWDLPVEEPTLEQMSDYFIQVRSDYEKMMNSENVNANNDRKKKIVDGFLGKYGA